MHYGDTHPLKENEGSRVVEQTQRVDVRKKKKKKNIGKDEGQDSRWNQVSEAG